MIEMSSRRLFVTAVVNEVAMFKNKHILFDFSYVTEKATREQSFRLNNFRLEKRVQYCLSHFISFHCR